ncbi:hypothetical protein AB835_06235 [Candidatus Endobugula sertula]|uniref:FHA domain-containing protein n=1 Tax=Candidatus Endobugula sertula TaxID=62101 RepID=A0A1D2QQR3_9GAMM|nr:hypothetical protein AB835_06235 [Candidatus Endobugula sertula]
MAIVIEIVNRSGQVLDCQVFYKDKVTVGRAYYNDLVLADSYVDPVHIQLSYQQDSDSISCEDKQSVNGVYGVKQKKLASTSQIQPGDTITIGKTLLRVSSVNANVEPAIPLSFWEELSDTLTQWWFILCASLLLGILIIIDIYISTPLLDDKTAEFMQWVYVLIGLAVYGGLFSFIGRVLHHDNRFFLYYVLSSIALVILFLYGWLSSFIVFNGYFSADTGWIDKMVLSVVIACLLNVSLRFSTYMRCLTRGIIVSVLPMLVLMSLFVNLVKSDEGFHSSPPYNATVFHQSLYVRKSKTPEEFVRSSQALYLQAQVVAEDTPSKDVLPSSARQSSH